MWNHRAVERCAALVGSFVVASCSSSSPESGDAGATDAGVSLHTPSPCETSRAATSMGGWEVVCNGDPYGHFLSVWGASPNDVYLVGGRPSAQSGANIEPGETVIWHWDGRRLEPIENPGTERAWWVFGTDADHVYVVGERGLGLKRISHGAFQTFDTGTTQTIYGIWGASPRRLYFASGDFISSDGRGKLHVLTSTRAWEIDDDDLTAFSGKAMFKVWGAAENDVFASGERGAVFHFDGTNWSRMATPDAQTPVLTISGRSGTDVYAVGGRGQGTLWTYDGTEWNDAAPNADAPGLMGVFATGGGEVLVSGESGYLATFAKGMLRPEAMVTEEPLHAVWADGARGAWAVGGNLFHTGDAPTSVVLRKVPVECPSDAIRGRGHHHLDLQGRGGTPRSDGSYPMFDEPRGTIHRDLVHGEHYLLGAGSFVDFTIPLCDDITDEIAFRLPNNDETGSIALHQLFVVRGDREVLVAETIDDVLGNMGYMPFDRSSLDPATRDAIARTDTHPSEEEFGWEEFANAPAFDTPPRDILAKAGDTLLFRTTNLSDAMYGLMVWFPQRGLEYQAFLEVRVPESPGGEDGTARAPPPVPGPCAQTSRTAFVELGGGGDAFTAFPPNVAEVAMGPQGSLMFVLGVRGIGFEGGDPSDPFNGSNPRLILRLALDAAPSEGGRIVADGSWRRGFTATDGYFVLADVRPSVSVGAATRNDFARAAIFAEVVLVDATTGLTLCKNETFMVAE